MACYLHALHSLFLCGGSTRNCSSYTSILGRRSVNIVLYVPQCLFKLELSHCVLRQTLKSKTQQSYAQLHQSYFWIALLIRWRVYRILITPFWHVESRKTGSYPVKWWNICVLKVWSNRAFFYFLSCAQSTNPSGFLIELFNKCKTPNEVSCPPASRNHCRNISTNYQSYLMVKMHLGVWNTLIRFFSIKHNPGKKVKHSSMY